jgi:hypothetical protein
MQDCQAGSSGTGGSPCASPQAGAPASGCQLEGAAAGARPPSSLETLIGRLRQRLLLNRLRAAKLLSDPGLLLRKLRGRRAASAARDAQDAAPGILGLQPGERVQVRAEAEIALTLDARAKLEGLAFVSDTMSRFCGDTFTVRQRVDRFFDERTQRMLKPSDVVIQDAVYCEPADHMQSSFAGCQRACFLFWKEAWLRRVDE